MKKILALLLSISLILCLPISVFAAETQQSSDSEEMKDILLSSTDDYFIVVSVPESEAEAYQKRLDSDPEFRESEIQAAFGSTSVSSRTLPPGIIDYQSYMYRADIQKMVDSAARVGAFARWLQNLGRLVTLADIAGLIELSDTEEIFVFVADTLGAYIEWVQAQQKSWWEEALRDIINGVIKAVRLTIIQSNTEYPKAWRVLERI